MYENLTVEQIKAQIVANMGTDLDTRSGSFIDVLISPLAVELWKYYQSLDRVIPIVYVDETSGAYIDLKCAAYGITRKPGTKASASMTFSGTAGLEIPAGTAFLTAQGLRFGLAEAVTLDSDGTAQGTVTADAVGSAYNVAAGEINRMYSNLYGLQSFENGAAAGGTDAEQDADLVARLYSFLQRPATSGNVYHYQQWALSVPGVGGVKVTPLWDGPGTVRVLLVDANKESPAQSIVEAAEAYIETQRPIGATVTVAGAEGLPINVQAAVTIDGTTTKAQVQAQLEQLLQSYLQEIALEAETLLYNRVVFLLLSIPGVTDYTALTLNGGQGNITIGAAQVATLGTVSVS